MSTGSQAIIREIEESLKEWKTNNDINISSRLSYIQRCRDIKYQKLLNKDIYRIERLKWKTIDSLGGIFSEKEWRIVFEDFGTISLLRGTGELRQWVQQQLLEGTASHYKKGRIQREIFISKLMRLSRGTLNLIEWLNRYSIYNTSRSIDAIIECLCDETLTRKNKLKQIERRSH